MKKRWYRCPHCRCYQQRESNKGWIKSFCERTGGYSRIIRVSNQHTIKELNRALGYAALEGDLDVTSISPEMLELFNKKKGQ